MPDNKEKIYCSLDIETSGFDPSACDILEVGFCFFKVAGKGLKIVEEYTQVFRPTREVPANILGLTGIGKNELDSAPGFSEHREYIQSKLKDAVIVGHNVGFDIKFLQGFGIKFEGPVIDTLEIVQFILPTHHSYNLENLMHIFQVEHRDAHRALADSKAAVRLLEKMLKVYHGFPDGLKKQIAALIKNQNFPWKELLLAEMAGLPMPLENRPPVRELADFAPVSLRDKTIYNFPPGENFIDGLAWLLKRRKDKILLVVPRMSQAMDLWRRGLGYAVFPPELKFSEEKFERQLRRSGLTPDEAKFLLKILVWKYTNWQTESIVDLNLSFAGGQFRSMVTGGKITELTRPQTVVADLPTFFILSKLNLYAKRSAAVAGLSEFESAASAGIGSKVSWGFFSYYLKSFYNPGTGTGEKKYEKPASELMAASDLFFGLTSALLQTDPPSFQYFKISPETAASPNFQKIKLAAENFIGKIKEQNKILKSDELETSAENLADFFRDQDNTVKWIELAENRCVFFSSPLDISKVVSKLCRPYAAVLFADSLGSGKIMEYFKARLGLSDFSIIDVGRHTVKTNLSQGDLFHRLIKSLPYGVKNKKKVLVQCLPRILAGSELLEILQKEKLPGALLFGSPLQVREFYDQNYELLKTRAFLLAQNNAGGSNKIFRNFEIHSNSLLLATDKFVLKHLNNKGGLDPVEKIRVKTLLLGRLPFEQYTHPYQEALAARFQKPFEEYSLPRALHNLHRLLNFFNTNDLERVILFDAKLSKDYAKIFIEYLRLFPNFNVEQG